MRMLLTGWSNSGCATGIMEEIWGLSRGNIAVQETGPDEYFETFFDWFPYEGEPEWYPAMTPEEAKAVREVCKIMQRALSEAGGCDTADEVVLTGWPGRVAPVAQQALDVMLDRGRFSEDDEESEPSTPVPWP